MSAEGTDRGAVVVTGSSTGIGRACVLALDRAGFEVFAGVRKPEDGESLRAEASPRLEPLIIDVADGATIAAAADRVREATGGRLAGLVNNAGITIQGPLEAVPLDDYRRQLEVNVIGQVAVTQAFLAMIRAARGRVVFMSSIGGRGGLAYLSPYNASKCAIGAIGDSLRQEMRPFGVEVSIVEPGAIATGIWDKGLEAGPALREAMGPQMNELYGDRLDRLQALAVKTGAGGLPPEEVAEVVEHALTAAKPKTVYVVGREAKITAVVRKLLPRRAFDRIVERRIESA
jgi:NAD(P)-dependent dehydrogenase (short-subunit alcohol dehydrogenase family)